MDTYENYKRRAVLTNEERRMKGVLSIYHPNAKGTGGALKIAIVPASEKSEGRVWMMAARQSLGAHRGFAPSYVGYPLFDLDGAICASLSPVEVAEIIRVFRGETESLIDGAGLFFKHPDGHSVVVRMEHAIEPVPAYRFKFIHSHAKGDGEDMETTVDEASIAIFPAEALTVMLALEHSMRILVFGE